MDQSRRYRFRHAQRLHGRRAFTAVFAARLRKSAGPLTVCARANDLPYCRLGLSVSRHVGAAVTRNRIKRLVREAFRLCQHDWPRGYDLVVIVRPHDPLSLAAYQKLLFTAIRAVHMTAQKRAKDDS